MEIVKQDFRSGRTDILVVYNWDEDELQELSLPGPAVTFDLDFDLDSYKLLISALMMFLCPEWRIMVQESAHLRTCLARSLYYFNCLAAFPREIYAQRTCQPRTF